MKLAPLSDLLFVRPDPPEEETAGGVLLPADAQERPVYGAVLAVGPKCREVNAGERILYSKYGGQPITVDGETLLMLRERDDVIAVEAAA